MSAGASRGPRIVATGLVVAAGLAACAKVGPPPGGPEDRDPPSIAEMIPPDGAAGVGPDSAIVIVFSEKLDRRSVMRALSVVPPVDFRETRWDEGRLTLRPETAWSSGRNTLIRIATTAKDRRGNALASPFATRFTTKAVPDSGALAGRLWLGLEKSRRARPVVLAFAERDTIPDVDTAFPDAIAEPDAQGKYRLEGLDPGLPWHVVGILDVDADLRALAPAEARGAPPGRILFAPSESMAEVPDFLVGTLDSLGQIGGEIVADSAAPVIAFARRAAADSAGGFASRLSVPGGGTFQLEVPTGFVYDVGAFVDADGDSVPGTDEASAAAESPVELLLTATKSGIRIDLATPPDSLPPLPEGAPEAAAPDPPDPEEP